ncbi:MAG TPA: PfkB family carbohydrate kinase [Anaeromyxobacteraceae bacterium]|nr:PfkB family carbohydrate kinase [Anaeromyxobacteraceae bacterium]
MSADTTTGPLRLAVVGHVEHITLGRVPALPGPGEIVHLEAPRWFPGGGGGVPFWQMVNGPTEVHFFTALGDDEAGSAVAEELARSGARIHAARRAEPHTRNLVMVTPDAERTIIVVGEPQHPRREDPLPWELLARCDAAYFTAQDPAALRAARAARLLIVTARRREALERAEITADVVLGSALDGREVSRLADYPRPPRALVLTEGPAGGRIETAEGVVRFRAPPPPSKLVGAYGAGDSFAGALAFYLAAGLPLPEACERAGRHGAAVLAGLDPRDHQLRLALAPSA